MASLPQIGAVARPFDFQRPARQIYRDLRLEKPPAPAGGHSGGCAGAAGQRLPDPALEDPKTNVRSRNEFHKAHIDAIRKSRMRGKLRADYSDGGFGD